MSFNIKISSLSSIILIIISSLSLFIIFLTLLCLYLTNFKTSSTKLLFLLNLSIFFGTISKLPFLYNNKLCQVNGFIVNYCGCQILIITYYLFTTTNISNLIINSNQDENTNQYKLEYKKLFIILFLPILFGILPIIFSNYHRENVWCQLDKSSSTSSIILFIVYIGLWIIQLFVFYELFKIIYKLWKLPYSLIYITLSRIVCSPSLCAIYTAIIFICIDIVILYSTLYFHHSKGEYYIDYTYSILQYFLGIGYGFIYYLDKKNIEILESYVHQLYEFERAYGSAFSGSISSASALSEVKMNTRHTESQLGIGEIIQTTGNPSIRSDIEI